MISANDPGVSSFGGILIRSFAVKIYLKIIFVSAIKFEFLRLVYTLSGTDIESLSIVFLTFICFKLIAAIKNSL